MAINPNLLALLGQQAGTAMTANPLEAPAEDIVVQAAQPLEYTPQAYRMNDAPTEDVMINQAPADTSPYPRTQASPQEVARAQQLQGLPEHKGMFGLKGTLRNVLGTLGDAFLVNAGGKQIYAPQRQQERMSDALIGFGQGDPNADKAAIARVMAVDPEAGAKLLEQAQMADYRRGTVQAAQSKATAEQFNQARTIASNVLNMVRQRGDLKLLPAALARIQQMTGYTPDQLGLSPDMSLDDVGLYAYSGIKGAQQENIDIARDRLEQTRQLEEMKEQGRNQRYQPRTPPKGRAQTELEYYQEVGKIPPAQRTTHEQDFYTKYTKGTRGGSRIGAPPPPPPAGSKPSRFRIVD